MNLPVQIVFRNCMESVAISDVIRERVERLERFSKRIIGCRVVVEKPHRHQQQGGLYHVRVDLTVPGKEIVVRRDPSKKLAHKDVYVAIRDAFDAVRRQLEDYARERRGEVKHHETRLSSNEREFLPEADSQLSA